MDTQVRHRFQVRHRAAAAATIALVAALLAGCGSTPQEATDTDKEPAPKAEPAGDEPSVDSDASGQKPTTDEAATLWSNTAGQYVEGTTIDINCPEGGTLTAGVWGGDNGIYTDDSAICVAAVHAGLITVDDGGTVVIEKIAGQETYGEGFTANGVKSLAWPEPWSGSFIFPES